MFKKLLLVMFFVFVFYLVYDSFNSSYAYPNQSDIHYKLFYNDNIDVLNNNIKKYVDSIDDIIMVNATYEDSSLLSQNYSFLTNFAIKYIILHDNLFNDDVVIGNDYKYRDLFGGEKITNKYVSFDTIYFVTDWYFGIRDYYVGEFDELVPLTDISVYEFAHNIKSSSSYLDGDIVKSTIIYEDDSKYLYSFYVDNNVLKIRNVEVIE